tara:strand:- start:8959 stop:11082 length:2124 start_codon:yes stop_codon:yes gene_type:complete
MAFTPDFGLFIEMYLRSPYLFDFAFYLFLLFAIINNKKIKEQFGDENATKLIAGISVALSFFTVLLEYTLGTNIGDYASMLVVVVGVLFSFALWVLLQGLFTKANAQNKITLTTKIVTGLVAFLSVFAFLGRVFGTGILSDGFSGYFESAFELIGASLNWLLLVFSIGLIIAAIKGVSGWNDPINIAARKNARISTVNKELKKTETKIDFELKDLKEEMNAIGSQVGTFEKRMAAVDGIVENFEQQWQEIINRIDQIMLGLSKFNKESIIRAIEILKTHITGVLDTKYNETIIEVKDLTQTINNDIQKTHKKRINNFKIISEKFIPNQEKQFTQLKKDIKKQKEAQNTKLESKIEINIERVKQNMKLLDEKINLITQIMTSFNTEKIKPLEKQTKSNKQIVQNNSNAIIKALKNFIKKYNKNKTDSSTELKKAKIKASNTIKEIRNLKIIIVRLFNSIPDKKEINNILDLVNKGEEIIKGMNKIEEENSKLIQKQKQIIVDVQEEKEILGEEINKFIKETQKLFAVYYKSVINVRKESMEVSNHLKHLINTIKEISNELNNTKDKRKIKRLKKEIKKHLSVFITFPSKLERLSNPKKMKRVFQRIFLLESSYSKAFKRLSTDRQGVIDTFIKSSQPTQSIFENLHDEIEDLNKTLKIYMNKNSTKVLRKKIIRYLEEKYQKLVPQISLIETLELNLKKTQPAIQNSL